MVFLAVVAYWLLFFQSNSRGMAGQPAVHYGYVVPLLCAVLFWRRWPKRPVPNPRKGLFAGLIICCLRVFALPLRVLFEAKPEWRLLYWISGLAILTISLCVLDLIGGFQWVRYFTPCCSC